MDSSDALSRSRYHERQLNTGVTLISRLEVTQCMYIKMVGAYHWKAWVQFPIRIP